MSSLDRSLLYAWLWNQWFGVLSIHLDLRNSVNLHFRKGIILCGKHRQARLFRERWELYLESLMVSPPCEEHCLSLGWPGGIRIIQYTQSLWGSSWASESNIYQTIDLFLKLDFSIWKPELCSHWGAEDIQLVSVFVWLHSITWIQMKFETA